MSFYGCVLIYPHRKVDGQPSVICYTWAHAAFPAATGIVNAEETNKTHVSLLLSNFQHQTSNREDIHILWHCALHDERIYSTSTHRDWWHKKLKSTGTPRTQTLLIQHFARKNHIWCTHSHLPIFKDINPFWLINIELYQILIREREDLLVQILNLTISKLQDLHV